MYHCPTRWYTVSRRNVCRQNVCRRSVVEPSLTNSSLGLSIALIVLSHTCLCNLKLCDFPRNFHFTLLTHAPLTCVIIQNIHPYVIEYVWPIIKPIHFILSRPLETTNCNPISFTPISTN